MGTLDIRALGPLEVSVDGRPVPLGSGKQTALLALLALRANRPVPIDDLVEVLWGDPSRVEELTATLRVYVTNLRKLVEPGRSRGTDGRITWETTGYRLRVGEPELDVLRFDAHLDRARRAASGGHLAEAVDEFRLAESLWRGAPFPEIAHAANLDAELAALENHRLAALEDRFELELALGRHSETVAELMRLAAAYPLRERLHGELILALYRDGRQADALDAYRRLQTTLAEELGVDPAPFVAQLEVSILRHDPALDLSPVPAQRDDRRRHRPPSPPNPLIGRDREVADVVRMLQAPGNRLVTLCGPGGVGKTRLALAAATVAGDARAGGACFVSLAGLTDPALTPQAVADALGIADVAGDPLTAVTGYLADRAVLLVLDNFEQLSAAAPVLGQLVSAAPAVSVLVTSRTVLRISGEVVYPVRPLAGSAAVQLFGTRARAVRPDFELAGEHATAVAEICRRLEGLPLAIELAAARVRVLSPTAILRRLGSRLGLLTGGPVDAPDRQRTLRATLNWSYELLDDAERRLLAQLSVFRGGFSLDAAEAVCGGNGDGLLDTLDGLVRHSLVQLAADPAGELRFALLETVREFAAEQLDAGAVPRLRTRHAAHYSTGARAAGDQLGTGAAAQEALSWLRTEQDNIRAALGWAVECGAADTGQRLLVALTKYWEMCGAIGEGLDWSGRVMALDGGDPHLRAQAFNAAGTMAWYSGQYPQARRWHQAAFELQEAAGDVAGMAASLNNLAAQDLAVGRGTSAERLMQQAVGLAREVGDRRTEARVLQNLGCQRWAEGDQAAAERLTEESLTIARNIGEERLAAGLVVNLGEIVAGKSDLRRGAELLQEGVRLCHRLGETYYLACGILSFAEILLRADQPRRAMRLLGAISALREQTGLRHHDPVNTDQMDRLRTAATAALGPTAAAAAWAEGLRLTIDSAVQEVVTTQPSVFHAQSTAAPAATAG